MFAGTATRPQRHTVSAGKPPRAGARPGLADSGLVGTYPNVTTDLARVSATRPTMASRLLCFALVIGARGFRATAGRRIFARTRMAADGDELWWEPEELDVVEYQLDENDETLGVGVVMRCGGIHPLCVYQEGGTHFVWDEELEPVAGDLAVRVIDGAILSTRQAKRGVDNPHGEHAEDVFVIDDGLLDARVKIIVRPDRET